MAVKYDLKDIPKEKLRKFLFMTFELTEEEEAAFHGFDPMTKELFFSIADKCIKAGAKADDVFENLLWKYPEFLVDYSDYLEKLNKSGEWKDKFL